MHNNRIDALTSRAWPEPGSPDAPSADRRELFFPNHLIHHRGATDCLAALARLQLQYLRHGRARGMLLTGQSGAGKSTVIEMHASANPRTETEDRTLIPILSVATPSKPTVKNLASELLRDIGDPLADRGTEHTRTTRLTHLMDVCGVEMIIIDEIQHFIDHRSPSTSDVTDWLKNLQGRTKRPIVLVGPPRSAELLRTNPQLARRFTLRMELEPFSTEAPELAREFLGVLKALTSHFPCSLPPLHDPEMAMRFLCASGGLIDYVVQILQGAVELHAISGDPVDAEMLAESFRSRMWQQCPRTRNPFLAPLSELRFLDGPGEPFELWDDYEVRQVARCKRGH